MKTLDFVVRLDRPEGARIVDIKRFIHDAISCHIRSLRPDDPMFNLHRRRIYVFAPKFKKELGE
jgi:hypothetical protein